MRTVVDAGMKYPPTSVSQRVKRGAGVPETVLMRITSKMVAHVRHLRPVVQRRKAISGMTESIFNIRR